MKKLLLLVLCMFVCFTFVGCGGSYIPPENNSDVYEIENIKVEMNVNEDNSIDIIETISPNFYESRKGIVRMLPLIQTERVIHENGSESVKNFRNDYSDFKNLSESAIFDVYETDGVLEIKVGNAISATGIKQFKIGYTLHLGDDRTSKNDKLYYNIIGAGWDTNIRSVDFAITFPKVLENQKIYLYSGAVGSQGGKEYLLSGTTFALEYNDVIKVGEALTIYTVLENGYFVVPMRSFLWDIILIIAMAALVIGSAVVVIKFRKMKPIIEVVEFSSPDDLNSAEVGFIIDHVVDDKDIVSLIVLWAEKGYLNIIEKDKKTLILEKLKDMDGADCQVYEKLLFDKIFEDAKNEEDEKPRVSVNSIGSKLAVSANEAKLLIKSSREDCFNEKSKMLSQGLIFATSILMGAVGFLTGFLAANFVLQMLGIVFAVGYFIIAEEFFYLNLKKHTFKKRNKLIFNIGSYLLMGLLLSAFLLFSDWSVDALFLKAIVSVVAIIAFVVISILDYRTKKGNELLGKLLGLKRFIEVAEEDRIKKLAEEDPEVFYHILPFAYVLGVSEVWIKKFEVINLNAPTWYVQGGNGNMFNFMLSMHLINHTLSSTNSAIQIARKAALASYTGKIGGGGGGSIGGGGFSGGGRGGGGGRSF